MAGKTKEMSQIKQLLLLKKEGVSNRKAAAIVGINKETVNNYVKKALADKQAAAERREKVKEAKAAKEAAKESEVEKIEE